MTRAAEARGFAAHLAAIPCGAEPDPSAGAPLHARDVDL
jgi:hypothetical protein